MTRQCLVGCFLWLSLWYVFSAGCTQRGPQLDKPLVGFAINTLNNPFFVDMKWGAEEAAKNAGIDLVVQATEREMDVEKQMQIVENFLQRGIRVLCLTPNGKREVIPAILKANRLRVPVVVVDSRVEERALREAGGTVAAFVGSDNVEGGRLAGEYIVRRLEGKGEISVLEGPPGHETGDSRLRGFHAAIDSIPSLRVVSSQVANFDRSQGFAVFQNILQAHPNVQAVFACNDLMALGAIEAIAAARKTGKVIVVGFDATNDAKDAIRLGRMDASIAQYPAEMGKVAVESAARILKGEEIPKMISTMIELITRDKLADLNTTSRTRSTN